MSRAQQLKSGDVSLGLAHEWVCAFGRQGGTAAMLQETIEDSGLMFRVVDAIIQHGPVFLFKGDALHALKNAVEKGVQCENGIYRFFDPGIPLIMLRNLSLVRQNKLVYEQDWYHPYDWATRADAPRERTLRVPVEGSFDKAFPDQGKLLSPVEEGASARCVATFLIINAMATGERLLPDCYVRCADKDSDGRRVYVGGFDRDGLHVYSRWDDRRDSCVGLASSRKC
jgi:hypothetical protein